MPYGTIRADAVENSNGDSIDLTQVSTENATTSADGYMSSADKTKLDGIQAGATDDQTGAEIKAAYEGEADTNAFTDAEQTKLAGIATGAEVNVATDLTYTASTRELASSTGTNATLPEVVAAGDSGLMTGADKTKLDGVEAGAQVNTVTSVNGQTGAVTVSGSTDLSYTASTRELASSTGNNVTLPEAVASGDSGLLSGTDKATIDGLATVATSGDYDDLINKPAGGGLSLTGDDLIINLPGYFGTVDGNGVEQTENIRIGQPYYNAAAKRGGDQIVITDSEGWATLEDTNCSNFGIAIGRGFDRFNTSGGAITNNVVIGDDAAGALSSGDGSFNKNTLIGHKVGAAIRHSTQNTMVGCEAGYGVELTSGSGYYATTTPANNAERNTFIGYRAGYDINTGDNNIAIGYQAGRSGSPSGALGSSSNVVVLGDNSINNFYCADTSISSSDARDKTDIEDFTHGLSFIQALRPVTYRWDKRAWYLDIENADEDILDIEPTGEHKREKLHLGFIAQEMEAVEQAHGFANDKNDQLIVNLNEDNTAYGVKYERLVPVLVNAIKELKAEIEELKNEINS